MHTAPTVIVLAPAHHRREPPAATGEASPWHFHSLLAQIARALDSGLPVALVAPSATIDAVRRVRPQDKLIHSPLDTPVPEGGLIEALRAGVQTCASSPGWIMLPAQLTLLQATTLREIGAQLNLHPVAYASHQSRPCMPIGFGPELYSELMRIGSDRELQRLINRYPSTAVEVGSPERLMGGSTEPAALIPTAQEDSQDSHFPR